MSYHIRFIFDDVRNVSLSELEFALKDIDANYKFDRDESDETEAILMFGDEEYGQVFMNLPNDGLFDEEITELIEFLEDTEGENKQKVLNTLQNSKQLLCLRVLDQGRESEETLIKIDPIWKWCFENRKGLMQADLEGYYDASGLILEVK
jgi:hypothetical protein